MQMRYFSLQLFMNHQFSNSGISLWFVKALSAFVCVVSRKATIQQFTKTIHEKQLFTPCAKLPGADHSPQKRSVCAENQLSCLLVGFCAVRATLDILNIILGQKVKKKSLNAINIMNLVEWYKYKLAFQLNFRIARLTFTSLQSCCLTFAILLDLLVLLFRLVYFPFTIRQVVIGLRVLLTKILCCS